MNTRVPSAIFTVFAFARFEPSFAADPFIEKIIGKELKDEFIRYKREEWTEYHQTVSQWTAVCPVEGRCSVAPVYQTSVTTLASDVNGMVSVAPLQIAGPEVTDVVATSGTQGFVSLTIQKHR